MKLTIATLLICTVYVAQSQTPEMRWRKYHDSLDAEIGRQKKEWEDAYRKLIADSILQAKKIKDTTSLYITIKHPGELFEADRINQAEVYGGIAIDSVKHGKRDTLFINGKKYLWVQDKSKLHKRLK
jgi:hypothetical protein